LKPSSLSFSYSLYIHLAFNTFFLQLPSSCSLIIRSPLLMEKTRGAKTLSNVQWGSSHVYMNGVGSHHWIGWRRKKIVVGGSLRFMIVFSTTSVPPVFLCLSLHALWCLPLHTFEWLLLVFAFTMCPWVLDEDPLFLFPSQILSGKVGPTRFQQMLFFFSYSSLVLFLIIHLQYSSWVSSLLSLRKAKQKHSHSPSHPISTSSFLQFQASFSTKQKWSTITSCWCAAWWLPS